MGFKCDAQILAFIKEIIRINNDDNNCCLLKRLVTHSELISFGIVRGIWEAPTQTMVSLEQEHPEGHLKFFLDCAASQTYRNASPASSQHGLGRAMLVAEQ